MKSFVEVALSLSVWSWLGANIGLRATCESKTKWLCQRLLHSIPGYDLGGMNLPTSRMALVTYDVAGSIILCRVWLCEWLVLLYYVCLVWPRSLVLVIGFCFQSIVLEPFCILLVHKCSSCFARRTLLWTAFPVLRLRLIADIEFLQSFSCLCGLRILVSIPSHFFVSPQWRPLYCMQRCLCFDAWHSPCPWLAANRHYWRPPLCFSFTVLARWPSHLRPTRSFFVFCPLLYCFFLMCFLLLFFGFTCFIMYECYGECALFAWHAVHTPLPIALHHATFVFSGGNAFCPSRFF